MIALPYLRWLADHWWHIYGAMGALFVVVAILHLVRRRRASGSTSHGSARWATEREIRKAGLFGDAGVMLGRYGDHYLLDQSESHILVIAPTRSGKGVGICLPTLLTWDKTHGKTWDETWSGSVFVTDPKDGENYDVSAKW